ncbi:TetR/AcrR family transcriptional regulator [Streptomyces sp. NBC_01386]
MSEQGVDVSLRDIARRADVGLATLLRHFPTREALLDALLRTNWRQRQVGSRRRARPKVLSSRGYATASCGQPDNRVPGRGRADGSRHR